MPLKGWYSKKDVIKDLSKATGAACELDEEYVVVGERPPPRTIDDEQDLDLLRLYGGHETLSPSNMDIKSTPDYKGITEMLRMVDQYNDVPDRSTVSETNNPSNSTIVISKLDFNVSEFVPDGNNSGSYYSPTNVNMNSRKVDLNVNSKNYLKNKNSKETETCDISSTKTCSVGTSSVESPEEIKEMRQKLKNQISDTSDATCVKVKKERNMAIAMLIKLHTQPNAEEKPKLITPDYYMRSMPQDETTDQKKGTNSDCNLICMKSRSQNDDDKMTDARESVDTDSPVFENSKDSLSKYMKESIQKVDNWLNSKEENESKATSSSPRPTAYFGPIKFKRKIINHKPLSPASVETERKIPKENDKFIPSMYASELTKRYEERTRIVDTVGHDIWTNLEKEMKARDKVILKKRLESNQD